MGLYTKDGQPLQSSGDKVYSRSGEIVGRIKRVARAISCRRSSPIRRSERRTYRCHPHPKYS
ncbi:hypothetical protein FJ434_29070 [Mesorhizobium sp. B2-5-13]|nr:hypothetical protein FJ432_31025 [Mesorhizobium sp. B2-6-5]TPJ73858.1 hypothetical protein FJ434_29070 [Mesorhizobium sp. B2-5-13]TPK39843.1 hypothetical protein FJ560_29160 [Mesorhizobium sp. B2-5-5]